MRVFALALLAAGLLAGPAAAGLIVAPTSLAAAEGNVSFSADTALTTQVVYAPAQLAGLLPGDRITGLQFRFNGGEAAGPAAPVSFANFDVYLGPSNFAPGSLSTSTAGNQGAGTVLARGGPITFAANSFPGGAGPNPFGPLIPFTTPYTYTGGDLLLTLSHSAPSSVLVFDADVGLTGVQGRQNGGYNSSFVLQNMSQFAFVVQFTTAAPAVPEPATVVVFGGLALAGAVGYRRRKQSA